MLIAILYLALSVADKGSGEKQEYVVASNGQVGVSQLNYSMGTISLVSTATHTNFKRCHIHM